MTGRNGPVLERVSDGALAGYAPDPALRGVLRLHLGHLGVRLTALTREQADRRTTSACRWKGRTRRSTTGGCRRACSAASSGSPPHKHAGGSAPLPRPAAQEAEHRAHEDGGNGPAQDVVPVQQVTNAVRQAEHPLTNRNRREHVIDQVRGTLRHPTSTAARAEAPAFAREGHEPSRPQSSHRNRANPLSRSPHPRNSRNSRSTNHGNPRPPRNRSASTRNVS
jgi:hypothetical protein